MSSIRTLTALLVALLVAAAVAQAPADASEADQDTTPALAAVGLSAGFPSYQTIAPTLSLQSGHFGFQAKASWTPAGPYVGLQVRGYPPVPVPLPVFVGVGAGFYGSDISYHAAVGAHVPLGLNLRFDIEGGVANVPLLDRRSWAPHLAAGVSYAFPVETSAGRSAEAAEAAARAPTCTSPGEPDQGALSDAVDRVVQEWILSARATYGSVYTDLSYDYTVKSTSVDGDRATVAVSYSGSVTEIATGKRHSASGEASATFRWNGCGWSNTGVSY